MSWSLEFSALVDTTVGSVLLGLLEFRHKVKQWRGAALELESPSTHGNISVIDLAALIITVHTAFHLRLASKIPDPFS